MASSWGDALSEQADLIASRLRQLMSSSLRFLHHEYGIDLGIKPELYPSWVIVCTALIGLVIAVVLLWVAACGGARRRKRPVAKSERNVQINVSVTDAVKTPPIKATKAEEPKKKNRKKATDKKTQSNGATVPEPQQEIQKVVKESPKQEPSKQQPPKQEPPKQEPPKQEPPKQQPPPVAAAAPPQPPADTKAEKIKKSKKKPKPEVKQTQGVSSTDGKELDEGAWETKISNREKRQQRKKEKGPGDESGSPGGGRIVSQQAEQPSVPAAVSTKKNKNNKVESAALKAPKAQKGDGIITPAPSSWNAVNSVSAGGWNEVSAKPASHVNALNSEKWSGNKNSEPLAWAQQSERSWPSRNKTEPNTVNLSRQGLKQSAGDPVTQSAAVSNVSTKVESFPADEWSAFNGLGAEHTGSDWNAPTEWWGNYEEPKVEKAAAQETPVSQLPGDSEDDKEKGDTSESGKAKRRKKKKKKQEDENAAPQVTAGGSSAPADSGVTKPRPPVPVPEALTKQNVTPHLNQKKSDQNLEQPKPVQKKKARRET
ncbi:metadherin a isoform X2 [Trichomycterus rosablanca]|uniref:metadherin a isoform X2 n=1 Tax=Trichomycterus rosablanca TaxID=2290929 RepID=UPI002F350BA8